MSINEAEGFCVDEDSGSSNQAHYAGNAIIWHFLHFFMPYLGLGPQLGNDTHNCERQGAQGFRAKA